MRHISKAILAVAAIFAAGFASHSCTDPLKFGNAFLEKAPGGTVTADTVFTNAEYTRQFLAGIYSKQYFALPTNSTNNPPQCLNYWKGMPEALSVNFQHFFQKFFEDLTQARTCRDSFSNQVTASHSKLLQCKALLLFQNLLID